MIISTPTPVSFLDRSNAETQNYYAMAGIASDGSVFCWGNSAYGGALPDGAAGLLDGTVAAAQIFSSGTGFAVIRQDGSVVSWGEFGLVSPLVNGALDGTVDVVTIASTQNAFAALREDGSVIGWGGLYAETFAQVAGYMDGTVPVREICTTQYSFVALREDGSIVLWDIGRAQWGFYTFAPEQRPERMFANGAQIAVLLGDGSVSMLYQGELVPVAGLDGTREVQQIYANYFSFAALMTDGSVVTWGGDIRAPLFGGTIPESIVASGALASGVVSIVQTDSNYCALRSDGTLVSWGIYDGIFGEGSVNPDPPVLENPEDRFVQITSNRQSYVALDSNGHVHAWGNALYGGDLGDVSDPDSVAAWLSGKVIVRIHANSVGYAALADDGTVISWGGNSQGVADWDGQFVGVLESSYAQVKALLTDPSNPVIDITNNCASFVAVLADGSFVSWGAVDRSSAEYIAPPAIPGQVVVFADYLNEDVILCGTTGSDVITADDSGAKCLGYDGDDTILGGTGADVVVAGTGNDYLFAGAGDDSVDGGLGNDLIVGGDGAGDDTYAGGAGVDTLRYTSAIASITVNLAAGTAMSTGGADAAGIGIDRISGIEGVIGGRFPDVLVGSAASNTLDGWLGADRLLGGAGNDTYILDDTGDRVYETLSVDPTSGDAGGVDIVRSAVSVSLNAYAGVRFVEKLTLTGTRAIDGTGNALANTLTGNTAANVLRGLAGDDVLSGGKGSDLLIGGVGRDTLAGGAGRDVFRFDSSPGSRNTDTIKDFVAAYDIIQLDDAVFTRAGAAGALSADAFVVGDKAADADDRIIFNSATGALLYDADGSGDGAAILFATISGLAGTLSASDFVII